MNRVCVYGAGSIGGNLAAHLAYAGLDVSVVARGANLAAIQSAGLCLETQTETITARVTASDDPANLGAQDLVLVTVKTPALPSVAAAIQPLLGPDTPVVFVVNGIPWWYADGFRNPPAGMQLDHLDEGGALHREIGIERTIGGVIYAACSVVAPGVIRRTSPHNRLIIGEVDGTLTPRLAAIAALLVQAGIKGEATADIRSAVWAKLLLNLGNAPIAVLTGAGLSANAADPEIAQAMRTICAEALQIADKLGSSLDFDIEGWLTSTRTIAHKPSILQDLELGRPMEVATLFDAPQDLARIAGVDTPVMDLILALARLRAKSAGLYG
jgi:2-dehydropantoate 2-reductase